MNAFLNKQIGWIGTGVMGKSMCLHLLNKNIKVNIYTRTEKKSLKLNIERCFLDETLIAIF